MKQLILIILLFAACTKESLIDTPECDNVHHLGNTERTEREAELGHIVFTHTGPHRYMNHNGFEWEPIHDGWIEGCVSVSLDILTPRTQCDNQYSALAVVRKEGHPVSQKRIWQVNGVENTKLLGLGCVSVYLFDESGDVTNSDCK